MDLGIAGKVALVTAASKGLGRGAALALSQDGARVAICARDPERLAATAAELPGEVLAIPADVTEPDAPARLVAATVERFGGLDILVANAGGPPPARALDVNDDQTARRGQREPADLDPAGAGRRPAHARGRWRPDLSDHVVSR